ncbi:MAG: hypothetical protein KQI81_23585 [Deltaproteobacteria bacterium]|nr:hypothetical protein [Deltaproteobacteria bacterium]
MINVILMRLKFSMPMECRICLLTAYSINLLMTRKILNSDDNEGAFGASKPLLRDGANRITPQPVKPQRACIQQGLFVAKKMEYDR